MNIAILAAGAGNMICGSCLRDSAMASALKRRGHNVTLIPLYTPLRTDADNISINDVYYGGVNVYLQHASKLFQHTPRALDWILDRPWLLRAAGDMGAQTTPDSVAGLTADILAGDEGGSRKELHRLIEFLKSDIKPQIISLPNLMFIGLADTIRRELGIPVVCELTGEDIFLDAMNPENRARMHELIRSRASHVSRFISASNYYASRMADYLGISRTQIDVIPTGLSPEFLSPLAPRTRATDSPPHVVGYLARICPEKGLDRLVDAMLLLRRLPGFENTRLRAAGYLGARDQKWFDALKRRIDGSPMSEAFELLGEVDRVEKIQFLDGLDVFCVPTAYPEAKGIYIFEALARAVPVVQPAHGSFPEILEQTSGGLLVPPGDAKALAEGIAVLLRDTDRRQMHGRAGRAAVEFSLTEEMMADRLISTYQALL